MADSSINLTSSTIDTLNRELSGYRVLRQVGHGAMGVVFEAEQLALGRSVAIKILPTNLSMRKRTVKRFLREAEAMGRLSHENIVSVHDVGSIKNLHYFCMKYVQGPPLDVVLKAGPLAIGDVVNIGIDVGEALAHAHSRGVLHRDIKPSNLLRDGARVVLTDFGLARPLDTEDTGTMTESGDLVGTPLYMAPEQISGDTENMDGRADVWGLGVTLFELLTQRPPFSGPNAQGILHSILHKDPPLLRKLRDDIPAHLEAVILKCLEKDPARRYSGAAALVEDLRAVRDGRAVSASAPRFFDPVLRWTRRNPFEAGVVAVAILLAAVFGVAVMQSKKTLTSTQAELAVSEIAQAEAKNKQDAAEHDTRAAAARYELSEARVQWARGEALGNELERRDAEFRLFDVLESLPIADHLDIMVEAIELMAMWMKQTDREQSVLDFVDGLEAEVPPSTLFALRAAAVTGLGRYDQALLLHRERAKLDPSDALPYVDSARVKQLLAEREIDDGAQHSMTERMIALRGREEMTRALGLHRRALQLAVADSSSAILVSVLVERARCYLALGHFDAALRDLELVLESDPSRLEAQSLKSLCARRIRSAQDLDTGNILQPSARQIAEGLFAAPVRAIGELLPAAPTLDTAPFESAGRGLQSIYRGLHSLLQDAATPEGQAAALEAESPAPEVVGPKAPPSGS